MEEVIIFVIIGIAFLLLLFVALPRLIVPGIYFGIAILALFLFYGLDQLFSVIFIPRVPWLMWGLWGGIIGSTLGFWSVAPRYGLRGKRLWITLSPFILMLLVMSLSLLFRTR